MRIVIIQCIDEIPSIIHSDNRPPPDKYKQYNESPPYKPGLVLREYQLEGLNWLIFNWYQRRNCILADEMGLGKTVQSMAMLNHLSTYEHIRGPFLVLAPLSTLPHWKKTIEGWTDMNCVLYHCVGGREARDRIRELEFEYSPMYSARGLYKVQVVLTTYDIAKQDIDIFENIRWKYMIIDEAQRIKRKETKIFAALNQIKSDSILLLTGTPIQVYWMILMTMD